MHGTDLRRVEAAISSLSLSEQLWLMERLAARIRQRASEAMVTPDESLAAMAADPDIQREMRQIEAEFAGSEADGLATTSVIMLPFVILMTLLAVNVLWPNNLHIPDANAEGSSISRMLWLAVYISIGAYAFYLWRATMSLCIRADEDGIHQTNGWQKQFVRWHEIALYTMENVGSYRDCLMEPVLRGADRRIVLRPMISAIIHDSAIKTARAEFWLHVTRRIDARRNL